MSATSRIVMTASDDFCSLFLAGAADALNDAMVTGDPPGPPANKIAAERTGLAYPFDGSWQKVPLSPRAGRGRDPWHIQDAPPDRRAHACAERGGRVRGSRRRILAGFPRRTADCERCDFASTLATRSLQPGQHRRSLDPHPVELVWIDAEDLEYCRGDLRCRDGCVDSLFSNIGMRND